MEGDNKQTKRGQERVMGENVIKICHMQYKYVIMSPLIFTIVVTKILKQKMCKSKLKAMLYIPKKHVII